MKKRLIVAAAAALLPIATTIALADDAAPPAAPAAPANWSDTLKFGVQLDGGIAVNPASPKNNLNYGQLYTDQSNMPTLNQALVSIGRPVDPKATDYDFGFKLQGMWGTDARYTHFARLFDKVTTGPYQFDINEASVTAHTPWFTEGGVDLQAGLWPTLLGYETIDPSTNPFYTHSYIFNFGLPVKEAGGNAIFHATGNVDIYLGLTAGNQTIPGMDNNSSASILGGVKLTLLDGNFSVLALTHYGPEDASRAIKPLNAADYNRAYNDVIITYKASTALTLTTELNYVREDLGAVQASRIVNAEAYGIAQYAAYTLTDTLTLNARAEAFVDTRSYFVAGYTTPQGPVRAVEGYSYPAVTGTGRNTYGALTLGVTYKPAMPDWAGSVALLVRPEARVDTVMAGNARFNDGKDRTAGLLSLDFVLTY
jgi:hypothetical protein